MFTVIRVDELLKNKNTTGKIDVFFFATLRFLKLYLNTSRLLLLKVRSVVCYLNDVQRTIASMEKCTNTVDNLVF